jgi:hypothetical protein
LSGSNARRRCRRSALVFMLPRRSTSEPFGVIRLRRRHSVSPANRDDPRCEQSLAPVGCKNSVRLQNSRFPELWRRCSYRTRRRSANRLCTRRPIYKEGHGPHAARGRSVQRCGGTEFCHPHARQRAGVT